MSLIPITISGLLLVRKYAHTLMVVVYQFQLFSQKFHLFYCYLLLQSYHINIFYCVDCLSVIQFENNFLLLTFNFKVKLCVRNLKYFYIQIIRL